MTYVVSGVLRYFRRDFDDAMRQYQKAIELDPSNPEAYKNLADVYLEKQDCSEATKQFVRAEELVGQSQNALALTRAFRISGCRGMLAKQLDFYADPANPDYYPMYAAANAAMLGKKELAFKFLTKAYETRHGIVELPVEPELDNSRSDSRYAELLRRMGLSAVPPVFRQMGGWPSPSRQGALSFPRPLRKGGRRGTSATLFRRTKSSLPIRANKKSRDLSRGFGTL
jgi:tetratricopeptide (TPR) repeat protein